MGIRRKARESTLQILFQLEFDNTLPEKKLQPFWKDRKASPEERKLSDWLVKGILAHLNYIDDFIQSVSENWRISRMALVDKNILRMAAFELLHGEDIAPAIVINEAIEIAKKYSSEQSATFVNGILDALRKKIDDMKKNQRN